ncbi:RNase adapter RapZ, partial [Burkholderia pseudomallei]
MFDSFGVTRAVPLDADFMVAVRALPNPYSDHELRPRTGLDQPVVAFLDALPVGHQMLDDSETVLVKWLPHFREDHR